MAEVVDITRVWTIGPEPRPHFVKKMKAALEKQGQIEPLQVQPHENGYTLFSEDPWGNETVQAARELGWKTLLVVEMRRYEQ
jgi:hypothetical protein